MKNNSPDLIDADEYRNTLGRFASGVTVVTVRVDGRVRGMTAISFCSVSLDPPLVGVSVGRHTKMHGLLPQCGDFGISILAGNQQALSDHFAARAVAEAGPRFEDVEGIPMVCGPLAHICCAMHSRFDAGDHTIYVGRVGYVNFREDAEPLIYYGGAYRSLAKPSRA